MSGRSTTATPSRPTTAAWRVRMAERLEVSKGWLSRFLDLAKLPTDIVAAFGDVRQLRENHAREIKPLLGDAAARPRVMAEARRLAALQVAARQGGEGALDAPKVIAALKQAAAGGGRASPAAGGGPAVSHERRRRETLHPGPQGAGEGGT